MVVFEGGAPKKSDYRRFTIRERRAAADDFASMAEVLGRRYAQCEQQARALAVRRRPRRVVRRAAEPRRDRRRQGPARRPACEPLQGFRERGVAVVSLAKRIEEVFLPGRADADRARRTTRPSCSCSSACATRRTASRSPTTAIRRDKAMTESIMDELPGIGPARKRALLKHFGSPEAVLGAPARGARGGARAARRRSRATSTPTSTRPADERHGRDAARRLGDGDRSRPSARNLERPRGHLRASPAPGSRRR